MAWIRSDVSLPTHPKTKRLARILGVPVVQVIGHLHALWYWCYEYAPDGDLSHFDPLDIAEAAMWDGDPDTFVSALLDCGPGGKSGFLERDAQGRLRVHDWDEYAGKLLEQRERDKERLRKWRARKDREETRNDARGNGDETRFETRFSPVSQDDETRTKRVSSAVRNDGETRTKRVGNDVTNDTDDTDVRSMDGDSLPSVENHHHAGASSGAESSQGDGEEPITNRDLIAELVAAYRSLPGVQPLRGDYPFIGRLYNDYGYDVVREALNDLAYALESGRRPKDTLVYLKGICRRQAGETATPPKLKVIPGGERQEKDPPYYRKVSQEELDYYAGLTSVPPPHLRPRPPFDDEEGAADGGS